MRWLAAVVALTVIAPSLSAQVVRGVVTDRTSGQPIAGVVVSVAAVPDSQRPGGVRHTLTNVRGQFALSLGRTGTYSLSAKRIGVARSATTTFELREGETKRFDVVLERFEFRLPVVRVDATNLCLLKPEQLRTIVALWDEARTALLAAEVSQEEHLLTGWLSQYTRSLEPRTLRILQEQRSVAEGRYDRPMRSISADSLAKVGYWRRQDADTMVFFAPDANALLSDSFQSGHCFELVTGSGERRGLLGLAFRPRRNQVMGGIDGTIWLDGGNFELRFVEFKYTNLITLPPNKHIGGAVYFLRHESGAWVVRRWFVRMPQFPQVSTVAVARSGVVSAAPMAYVYRVIEQGGGLFVPGLATWEKPGTIEGTMMDSTGKEPLTGTMVSLSGTPYSVEVDSSGRFRFDSLPPGAYTLLASHRYYADLGQLADDEPLNLASGQRYRANLKAITTSELLAVLCDGRTVKPTDATVRIVATHADSGHALKRLQLWLRWADPSKKDPIDPNSSRSISTGDGRPAEVGSLGVESMTDNIGAVTFCGVPAGARLELVMLMPDDDPEVPRGARFSRITGFVLTPGDVTSRTVSVRPPN